MVECEFYQKQLCQDHIFVLIDTWWNVNTERPDINIFHAVVLIDTWWNVNVASAEAGEDAALVLIDTWWNVNFVRISNKIYGVKF